MRVTVGSEISFLQNGNILFVQDSKKCIKGLQSRHQNLLEHSPLQMFIDLNFNLPFIASSTTNVTFILQLKLRKLDLTFNFEGCLNHDGVDIRN